MKGVIRSGLLWALIWSVGGWYAGKFDANSKANDSWLISAPFILVLFAAIAGMVDGRKAVGPKRGIAGILCGCAIGLMAGVGAAFLLVLVGRIGVLIPCLRRVDARVFWTVGGCVIGAVTGSFHAAFWKAIAIDFRLNR